MRFLLRHGLLVPLVCLAAALADDEEEVNLALSANGGCVVSVSSEARRDVRQFLNDGSSGGSAFFSFSPEARHPQAVTFAFARNEAARLQRLVLRPPLLRDDALNGRGVREAEIQISRISSTCGFESAGTLRCEGDGAAPQELDLGGRVARFVRLVVTSTETGVGGTIGDVEVWGAPLSGKEGALGPADESELIRAMECQGQGLVRVEATALEKGILADVRDFRLDKHSLMDAVLIASGADTEPELGRFRKRVDAFVEKLRRSGRMAMGGPRGRAWEIFEAMHRDLLTSYTVYSTDMRRTLEEGEYNCVTATALLMGLGERFGLQVSAEDVSGHVIARLRGGEESFYIETTVPDWFRMDTVRKKIAFQGRIAKDPGSGREITRPGMAAMIYYNRAALLLDRGLFREAVAAGRKATWADPGSGDALDNLLSAYTRFAFYLAREKRYDEALRAIAEAQESDPYRLSLRVARDVIEGERKDQGR